MELAAIKALQYCNKIKKTRLEEHRLSNLHERKCSGLTYSEWALPIRQKSTFSKSKKFACTRLWNHKHVPTSQGFESLTINTI